MIALTDQTKNVILIRENYEISISFFKLPTFNKITTSFDYDSFFYLFSFIRSLCIKFVDNDSCHYTRKSKKNEFSIINMHRNIANAIYIYSVYSRSNTYIYGANLKIMMHNL